VNSFFKYARWDNHIPPFLTLSVQPVKTSPNRLHDYFFSFPVSLSRYNVQAGFPRTAVNDFANESADCVLVAGAFYIFLFFIQRNPQVLKYAKDRPSPKVA
jgi:hypothetical protein